MIIDLLFILWIFFSIGIVAFGGGYVIIPLIYSNIISLGISTQQFADLVALDMIVPGPISINAATYVGYLNSGILGSIFATLGIALPSYILVLTILFFKEKFKNNKAINTFLNGVKPAAVGLIAAAGVKIAYDVAIKNSDQLADLSNVNEVVAALAAGFSPISFGLVVGTLLLMQKVKVNPVLLTIIGGVIGALFIR